MRKMDIYHFLMSVSILDFEQIQFENFFSIYQEYKVRYQQGYLRMIQHNSLLLHMELHMNNALLIYTVTEGMVK